MSRWPWPFPRPIINGKDNAQEDEEDCLLEEDGEDAIHKRYRNVLDASSTPLPTLLRVPSQKLIVAPIVSTTFVHARRPTFIAVTKICATMDGPEGPRSYRCYNSSGTGFSDFAIIVIGYNSCQVVRR